MTAGTRMSTIRPDAGNPCRWLTRPRRGALIMTGRVRLPEGYQRPEWVHGFDLTWTRDGDIWRFEGKGIGDAATAADAMACNWFGEHPVRFDSLGYEAPAELEAGEWVHGAEIVLDEEGVRPVRFVYDDDRATGEELAAIARGIVSAFGGAVTLKPWERRDETFVAEVAQWSPSPPSRRLSYSRWILEPFRGTHAVEGRVRLPAGVKPPTEFPKWLSVAWEDLGGDVYRYRATYRGGHFSTNYEALDVILKATNRVGCLVSRCDRTSYEAAEHLADNDQIAAIGVARIETDNGVPFAVAYEDTDTDDRDEIERTLVATFGDALQIGPWKREGATWRARVTTWDPTGWAS